MGYVLEIVADTSNPSNGGAQGTGSNAKYAVSFNENIENGTVIGTIANLDPGVTSIRFRESTPGGGDEADRYAIVGDAATGWKIIVLNGGTTLFNKENKATHKIYIEAVNASGAVVGEGDYTITIKDVNEAVTNINFSGGSSITIQAGAAAVNLTTASAVDPDTTNPAFRANKFMFADGTTSAYGGLFVIDENTGVIRTTRPATANETGDKALQVVAYDSNTPTLKSDTFTYTVKVEGSSNQAPSAPAVSGSVAAVSENATASQVVATVQSTDDGQGGALVYSIVTNPGNKFTINGSTGVISLVANSNINYETDPNLKSDSNGRYYELVVKAAESGTGGLSSGNTTIKVYVTDVNEAPTNVTFSNHGALQVGVSQENAVVTKANAVDPDTLNAGFQTNRFMFANTTNLDKTIDSSGLFKINPTTGVITTTRALTAADVGQKSLEVIAYDANNSLLQSSPVTHTFNISGSSNQAPSAPAVSGSVAAVSENTTASQVVATVQSTDDGQGGALVYSIVTNPGNKFTINGSTGVISLVANSNIDYENDPNLKSDSNGRYYELVVKAAESGTGGLSSGNTTIKVYVTDVNEAPTNVTFTNNSTSTSIKAGAGGTNLTTVSAVDPDTANAAFRNNKFSFADGSLTAYNGLFEINADTGVIRTTRAATAAEIGQKTLSVIAHDAGNNALKSPAVTYTVNVTAADNTAPTISAPANNLTIRHDENTNLISPFAGVTFIDPDQDDEITVTITGFLGKGALSTGISPNGVIVNEQTEGTYIVTGTVDQVNAYVKALKYNPNDRPGEIDTETTIFSITVTDKAGLQAGPNTAITVDSTAVNQAPTGNMLKGGTVQELAAYGTVVAEFAATDVDGDTLHYSVVDDGRFYFDGNVLKVANGAMINYETLTQSETIKIRVYDDYHAGVEKEITINVTDMRETLKGGNKKDKLTGGIGSDILKGGYGNDVLTGGAGQDFFVFNSKLGTSKTDRKVNYDTIKDFNVADDSIWLDNAIFKKLGKKGTESKPAQLNKYFFKIGTKAKDKNDYIVYNKKTGILSYDADGSGKGAAIEIAKLAKNLKLTYKDFFVV